MTFPHTATIQGLVEVGGISTYTTTGTTKCFLQPIDAEETLIQGMTFSKSFKCYLPRTAGVKEKQRLVIDAETYSVVGIMDNNYGSIPHYKAILEKR